MEMIVSTAIIMFVSGQVLVSFSGFNEASTLTRAAHELAFNIRRAQNMSVSIAGVNIGGVMQIPRAVGLRLSSELASSTHYFFFADQDGNKIYTGSPERIEPNILLPGNIRISSIRGELLANRGAHIIFYTPEARVLFTDAIGTAMPEVIEIKLVGHSGRIKKVNVFITGRVEVEN